MQANSKRSTTNALSSQHPHVPLTQLTPQAHSGALALQPLPTLEILPQLLLLGVQFSAQHGFFVLALLEARGYFGRDAGGAGVETAAGDDGWDVGHGWVGAWAGWRRVGVGVGGFVVDAGGVGDGWAGGNAGSGTGGDSC